MTRHVTQQRFIETTRSKQSWVDEIRTTKGNNESAEYLSNDMGYLPSSCKDIDTVKALGTVHLSEHLVDDTVCHSCRVVSTAGRGLDQLQ